MRKCLLLAVILFTGITHSDLQAGENIYRNSLKSVSETKKEKALQTYNLFKFIDPRGLFLELQKLDVSYDSAEIENLVGNFFKEKDLFTRPDTPDKNEYREEIMKRVEYCNLHFSTLLFGDSWDIRAEPVLKIGIPDETREIWGEDNDIFFMEWDRNYVRLVFQDKNFDGVYDGYTSNVENLRQLNRNIRSKPKPEVYTAEGIDKIIDGVGLSVASFKEESGKYSTYVSIGILGNKLKSRGDTAKFNCNVVIYDESNNLVIYDSSNYSIDARLLKIKNAWIPIYNSYFNLPPGKNKVSIKIENQRRASILLTEHQISTYKSLSDILLSETEPRIGKIKSKQQGIERNMKNGISYIIKENPSATLRLNDTAYTYLEINDLTSDSAQNYPYRIECLLRPLPKGKKKGEVELGPLITVGETLPDTLELKDFERIDFSKSKDKWPLVRLYSEKKIASDSTDYFKKNIVIPKELEPGAYVLQFVVTDNTKVPKVTWRIINIKK